ncbi:MAG: VOC family protein [Nevskiales bacterium]
MTSSKPAAATIRPRFHLAFPVRDIEATRRFYQDVLGCTLGREDSRWIDFDFHGHQISAHLTDMPLPVPCNEVDGKQVPVCHFGLILDWNDWQALVARLQAQRQEFLIDPYIRFKNETGEQATFFILDPSGNGLEFKAFRNEAQIFSR